MIYKKRKPVIYSLITLIMYIGLTVFIVLGLLNLLNFTYEDFYKEEHISPTSKINLDLKPILTKEEVSNNIIIEEKDKVFEEPIVKDKNVLNAMKVIENYYTNIINKNIKSHFSSNKSNMCKIIFKVNTSELIIMSCDDFTFKRQVELALLKHKPYANKVVNGVDLSKEVVYFDYLISSPK